MLQIFTAFLGIFLHNSGSVYAITLIWLSLERSVSLDRSFPPVERECLSVMPILIKGDDVKADHAPTNATAVTAVNGLMKYMIIWFYQLS